MDDPHPMLSPVAVADMADGAVRLLVALVLGFVVARDSTVLRGLVWAPGGSTSVHARGGKVTR